MKTKRAFMLIILAGILWGTSALFVHYLSPYGLTSLQLTCIRGVVSSIVMAIYVLITNKELFKVKSKDLIVLLCAGTSQFLASTLYYAAMRASSVSTAVVLMYTAPIFVMAFSVAFMGEKLTKLKFLSVFMMIVGCGLVSGIIGGLKFSVMGILMGFGSGISYSAYNIFIKLSMKRKINPMTAAMYCFFVVMILSIFISKPVGIYHVAASNPPVATVLMILCGICTCILPYLVYTIAMKDLPAGTATSLGIVEPMAATIFSVSLLGERLDIFSFTGIVLILLAVFLLSKTDN